MAMIGIVSEELKEENYEFWKVCLKSYLVGQGLWDVVSTEPTSKEEAKPEWQQKNAQALHAIQLACGSRAYSKYKKKTHVSAKFAWDHLAEMHLTTPSHHTQVTNDQDVSEVKEHLRYGNLYSAVVKDITGEVHDILTNDPGASTAIVSSHRDTALHVAILHGHMKMALELVKRMPPEGLEMANEFGATPLSLVAITEDTKLAMAMVQKNSKLVNIKRGDTEESSLPVIVASMYGKKRMVHYLYNKTPKDLFDPTKGLDDIASMLLHKFPKLGVTADCHGDYALHKLAHKPSAFASGSEFSFWKHWIYSCDKLLSCIFKEIKEMSSLQLEKMEIDKAVHIAIKHGIVEFVVELLKFNPEFIWRKDKRGRTIFSHAIILRQEKIFSLFYRLGMKKSIVASRHDIFRNNFLHLAAKLSPPSQLERVSGAALQMQRELQWYKEVESLVQPKYKDQVNENNRKPSTLFTEEHKDLAKEGEKWMKNTAGSSMIVGTLIAAVMFTTAFTVPGGNNELNGLPIMLNTDSNPFMIFTVTNGLSLFTSSTSVLMFLGILTARYAEDDFLVSLPTKLVFGIACLFFSIVTMMISFAAALYLMLHKSLPWVSIPLIVLSTFPVLLFSALQFPLLIEMVFRTYRYTIFDKPKKNGTTSKDILHHLH
ncbi:Ankyrin repeat-containing protein, partial [Cynara cardunculus var. scolymus]